MTWSKEKRKMMREWRKGVKGAQERSLTNSQSNQKFFKFDHLRVVQINKIK
jgi:hypothetical protein